MGRIHVLSEHVANKIAAGEVVERPASVLKELLENSLDAGATDVRIEIETGGRRLIRIADDGCGMLRDDAMLAFERHATSKLRDVKDLLSIDTLGFRGEALPSIASVSRLLLETRAAEEQTGATVEIAGGKMLRCDEAGLAAGTSISVRDLFFNVPARKKFLRSEQTELGHIASLELKQRLGVDFQFVPYRGGAPAMQDLISGQIDLLVDQAANSLPQLRADKIKAYAVLASERLKVAPEIPTVDEAGLPGFYVSTWHGMWAPRGTPPAVVERLNAAAREALATDKVKTRFDELGQDIPPPEMQTVAGLAAFQKAEVERWTPILKATGAVGE